MKMKILELRRGKSTQPVICDNGDVYDSQAVLMDWDGRQLYTSEHWNTDSTQGYKGGRLAPVVCYGIYGKRESGKEVVKLFSADGIDIEKIKSEDDIPEKNWRLKSEIPNPNHDGEMWMEFIQCHDGGMSWDYSHGCMSALNKGGHTDWDALKNKLKPGEIILFRLVA